MILKDSVIIIKSDDSNWADIKKYLLDFFPEDPPILVNDIDLLQSLFKSITLRNYPKLIIINSNIYGNLSQSFFDYIIYHDLPKLIPYVVFSKSKNHEDVVYCYNKKAKSFLMEPNNKDKYLETLKNICKYWIELNLI